MKRPVTRERGERGYILALASVTGIIMVVFMGMAIDVGYMEYQRSMMQAAADSAAAAAAVEGGLGSSSTTVTSAGQRGASLNGFTSGSNSVSVAINNPPLAGSFAGNSQYYESVVQQPMGTFFMRMLNFTSLNVTARGVAGLKSPAWTSNYCSFVLNSGATSGACSIQGYWNSQCGIQVNSTSSSAISCGHSCSGTTFRTCGGVSGGSYITSGATSTSQSSVSDPFSNLQAPSYTNSCDHNWYETPYSGNVTLSPGVYCGGITVHGSCNVTFSSGNYILVGGGLTANDYNTSCSLTGSGCHFYNTYSSSTCTYSNDWEGCHYPVQINTSGSCNLSAPTSGSQEGILFMDDRTAESSGYTYGSTSCQVEGATGSVFQGVIYTPNKSLTYSGCSGSSGYTCQVCNTLTVPSSSQQPTGSYPTCGNNYSSCTHGNPVARQNSCQLAE